MTMADGAVMRNRPAWRGVVLLCGLLACGPAGAELIALDNADNDPYPLGWIPGDNAGVGFTPWVLLDSGAPGGMYTTTAIDEDSYSWGINGTYALGRGFSNNAASGVFAFLAQHDSANVNFSGFNLKTSTALGFDTDDVLRFGIDPGNDTGISISTNAGGDYSFLDCGWIQGSGDVLLYQVAWQGGAYSISVSNLTEGVGASTSGNLGGDGDVAMFGMAVNGATTYERMVFDAFQGSPIPEPATCLLLVSTLALLPFRRKFQ